MAAKILVLAGDGIGPEIVAEAEDWGADVIVVSTHGRTGLSRLVLGSVANQVVNNAPCPVMLYRVNRDED